MITDLFSPETMYFLLSHGIFLLAALVLVWLLILEPLISLRTKQESSTSWKSTPPPGLKGKRLLTMPPPLERLPMATDTLRLKFKNSLPVHLEHELVNKHGFVIES